MHTLSIDDDGLMGSSDSTHVRSFSRYEYYLLEQAINGNNWIQPLAGKKRHRTATAYRPPVKGSSSGYILGILHYCETPS